MAFLPSGGGGGAYGGPPGNAAKATGPYTAGGPGVGLLSTFPTIPAVSGHQALLWFVGAVLLVALAGPFPGVITMLVVILIVLIFLKNYQTYFAFIGGH